MSIKTICKGLGVISGIAVGAVVLSTFIEKEINVYNIQLDNDDTFSDEDLFYSKEKTAKD